MVSLSGGSEEGKIDEVIGLSTHNSACVIKREENMC